MSASCAEHESQDPPAPSQDKKVCDCFRKLSLMKNGFLFPIHIISVEHRPYASQSGQEGNRCLRTGFDTVASIRGCDVQQLTSVVVRLL